MCQWYESSQIAFTRGGIIVEDDFKCVGDALRSSRDSLALQTSYDVEEEEIEDNEVMQIPEGVCIPCSRAPNRVGGRDCLLSPL
jgi:hypothetical protein